MSTPRLVAPGLAAPVHQHLFNVRLDVEVDGADNAVFEVDAVPTAAGEGRTPSAVRSATATTLLETRVGGPPRTSTRRAARARGASPTAAVATALGQPTAYKLLPAATPTLLAGPDSSIGRRAAFAAHNLWVTPFAPEERRAAGDYPNQHAGGAGLPAWTAQDRPWSTPTSCCGTRSA